MFGPPLRGPQLVALDPELAKTTPDSIWLSTGVRAVDHCVETLCSIQNPDAAVDEIALTALSHLVPGLLLCKKDRTDGDAYLKCQLGSAEAMEACSKGSYVLGASHGIGHQVTPIPSHHHISHSILTSQTARPTRRRPWRNKLYPPTSRVQVQRTPQRKPRPPGPRARSFDQGPRHCGRSA